MDLVSDQLFDGTRFRVVTIVDNFSRRCMAIYPEKSVKGENVVEILNNLKDRKNAVPERIQVDKGTEFISKALTFRNMRTMSPWITQDPVSQRITHLLNHSTEAFGMSV